MDIEQLRELLRARFTRFLTEHTPPLEDHPRALAAVPTPPNPAGSWSALAERGALALPIPRAAGGLGLGQLAPVLLAEMMGAAGFPAAGYLDALFALDILRLCLPDAEDTGLVEDVIAGRCRVAVAFRDDDTARAPDRLPGWTGTLDAGDDLLVTARRSMVVSADEVDTLLVLGSGAPDAVLLAVGDPAVLLDPRSTLGQRRLFDVDLRDARIPARNVFTFSMDPAGSVADAFGRARIRQAAYLVGLSHGAINLAVGHAANRRQFGQPLARFQSIAFRLAAARARLTAVRLLVYDAARRADTGERVGPAGARALALASDLGRATTAEAVHVHGAYGMTLQSSAQRLFRDAGTESVWLGTLPQLRRLVTVSRAEIDGPRSSRQTDGGLGGGVLRNDICWSVSDC